VEDVKRARIESFSNEVKMMKISAVSLASCFLLTQTGSHSAAQSPHRLERLNPAILYRNENILGELTRRLNEVRISEFCLATNLQAIEEFITEELENVLNATNVTFLSEQGTYECNCDQQQDTSTEVFLGCSAMYGFADGDPFQLPMVGTETMNFLEADGIYHPQMIRWCEYYDEGSLDGPAYCEAYTLLPPLPLSTNSTPMLESCTVEDTTSGFCNVSDCQVCDGGQTISISSEFCQQSIDCTENYMADFLFSYHLTDPIKVEAEEDEEDECAAEGPFVEDFCSDLTSIEEIITTGFKAEFPFFNVTSGYKCGCLDDDAASLSVKCEQNYTDEGGLDHDNTEEMKFVVHGNYYIPSRMQWCDMVLGVIPPADNYCESYTLAIGQEAFQSCSLNGCNAAFCELCANGKNVGHSCGVNFTCADAWVGSFLFPYRDTKIAIQKCTLGPTTPATVESIPTPVPAAGEPTPAPAPEESTPAPTPSSSFSFDMRGIILIPSIATILLEFAV
jgi:hypothetical protein